MKIEVLYITMFSSRPQGKRTTHDCPRGEGDPSVQLYGGSVLIALIGGTCARRSCDEQY